MTITIVGADQNSQPPSILPNTVDTNTAPDGLATARASATPRAASPAGTGATPPALPRFDTLTLSAPRATADLSSPSSVEPSLATPTEAPRIAIQNHADRSPEDGPRISFEVLKDIKSKEMDTRIRKNPSQYGSRSYEQKHINKWNGRPVSEYLEHRKVCKSAWLDKVPEKISERNLAMHGTNLHVVLLAMKIGGQLLPVGNLLKRGGTLVTGESGARRLNMRRVSAVNISGGLHIENVFWTARQHAWAAAHYYVKINIGRTSQVPIVVIGDGMDTQKTWQRYNLSPDAGIRPDSGVENEIAFKRLNIRGLLCEKSDSDYVRQVLTEEKINLTVTTYESFHEEVKQKPLLQFLSPAATPQRRQLLETLMGVALPDYPDWSEATRRPST